MSTPVVKFNPEEHERQAGGTGVELAVPISARYTADLSRNAPERNESLWDFGIRLDSVL
jgi:hypothetical protein